MTNPSKAKGTRWETELLTPLRMIFGPQVKRSAVNSPSRDFEGTGDVRVEAKKTEMPLWYRWLKKMRAVSPTDRKWAIIWSGDRRYAWGQPTALVDLRFLWELLYYREKYREVELRGQDGQEGQTGGAVPVDTSRTYSAEEVGATPVRVVLKNDSDSSREVGTTGP